MAETYLKIGEAARAVDLNPRTVRYYERCGLLKSDRTLSRYRIFGEEDLVRLKLVKQLRRLGFSIVETRQVLPILVNQLPHSQRSQKLKALFRKRLLVAERQLREAVAIHQGLQARLKRLSAKRKLAKDSCCEPLCSSETCHPGLVQIAGISQETNKGGGG